MEILNEANFIIALVILIELLLSFEMHLHRFNVYHLSNIVALSFSGILTQWLLAHAHKSLEGVVIGK